MAIKDIHKSQIIHLDIKPKNILVYKKEKGVLDYQHNKYKLKICDFGFSTSSEKVRQNDKNETQEYKAIEINPKGTPNYMAPELKRAKAKVDITQAVDTYSYGKTLIFLLTEKDPKEDDKKLEI